MSKNFLEKYKNNGLSGLANIGNTCYINSTMQILSHCYTFNELIESLDFDKLNNNNDSILLKEWKILKDLMWSKNCTISPNRFIANIQKISKMKNLDLFSGFAQNDLPEFLIFIVDCFHNSLKRKVKITISGKAKNNTDLLAKNCFKMIKELYSETYSELLDLFYGIHFSCIESVNSGQELSIKPEPYCLLSLSLPENKNKCNLYDCFDHYIIKELLNGTNAYYNETTNKKEDVYKYLNFWNFPNILIIDLKRFNNFNKKINTIIDFPIKNLDLRKYVCGYDKEKYIYDLFGITNHSGGCLGGHYTSFVKNANNKWYHFNDTNVSEISENDLITNKAYCLFYIKKSII